MMTPSTNTNEDQMESAVVEHTTQSPVADETDEEQQPVAQKDDDDDDDNDDDNDGKDGQRKNFVKKLLIGLILVGFIVFVVIDSLTNQYIRSGIDSFLEWIEDNPVPGFFLFMIVYFFATVLFVPGSILTLGAGFVFANAFGLGVGVLLGTLSVFFGASAGAVMAFILGRYLLRDWVQQLTKKYAIFQALDAALEDKGFRIMALLRLSPIIPFNAINYIAGVTAISLRNYTAAMLAILPGTVLYVFLGASAGSLADSASSGDNTTITIVVVVVGAVFGILAIFATSYYAKKELNRVIAEREEAEGAGKQGDDETNEEAAPSAGVEVAMGGETDGVEDTTPAVAAAL